MRQNGAMFICNRCRKQVFAERFDDGVFDQKALDGWALEMRNIKDLWRDSTGRPMGLVKVEPIDLTCSSFERLTTYMTKARARIRRWRQSQGLQKPKTPRPNDTRYKVLSTL